MKKIVAAYGATITEAVNGWVRVTVADPATGRATSLYMKPGEGPEMIQVESGRIASGYIGPATATRRAPR